MCPGSTPERCYKEQQSDRLSTKCETSQGSYPEKLAQKMHNNMSDNVSVDAFKKSKPGRGRGQGAGRGGGRGGYQHRSQSGYHHTSSGRQGKCSNWHIASSEAMSCIWTELLHLW